MSQSPPTSAEILKQINIYQEYVDAWERHVDFDGNTKNPHVVAVFSHEEGHAAMTESYIVADLRTIFTQIDWGEQKLGDFEGIYPIWPGIYPHPTRVAIYSYSLKSKAANAKAARDVLKKMLPKKLHRLISLARRINRRPKYCYLPPPPDGVSWMNSRHRPPDWYIEQTKGELFVKLTMSDHERDLLSQHMDPLEFWNCATGRVPHNEVADLIFKRRIMGE